MAPMRAPRDTGTRGPAGIVLPERYRSYWREPFDRAVGMRLSPGSRILDIGSGRTPSLRADRRPVGCRYVGLDISSGELEAAGPAAYDETLVGDITRSQPQLRASFDLAISWQVLEHVNSLPEAVANIHFYLRDGGALVSMLSGRFSVYACLNRLLPDRLGHALVARTMRRSPETTPVFPARYDRCYASALRTMLAPFHDIQVTPFYRAANYFRFSPTLTRGYLAYETFIARRCMDNLATHYLVVATR